MVYDLYRPLEYAKVAIVTDRSMRLTFGAGVLLDSRSRGVGSREEETVLSPYKGCYKPNHLHKTMNRIHSNLVGKFTTDPRTHGV